MFEVSVMIFVGGSVSRCGEAIQSHDWINERGWHGWGSVHGFDITPSAVGSFCQSHWLALIFAVSLKDRSGVMEQ